MLLANPSFSSVAVPFLTVAVLSVGLVLAWVYVARRFRNPAADDAATAEPFTLQDLRDLKKQGQISEAEYERLRAALVGRVGAAAPTPPRPKKQGTSGPRPRFKGD